MCGMYKTNEEIWNETRDGEWLDCRFQDEETGEKKYNDIADGQLVTMGAMISTYKKLQTRSGSTMAFITVEDMYIVAILMKNYNILFYMKQRIRV